MSRVARLHARLQRWADAGWSGSVVFAWGLLQGCVLPGLADLLFLPLALAQPARAYRLAFVAAAGTIIGSVALYLLGREALHLVEGPLAAFYGLSPARLAEIRGSLGRWGAWAILVATVSPLSVKLTSIVSGAFGVPLLPFVGALTLGRLGRTLVLAWLVRNGGARTLRKWTRVPEPRLETGG